MARAAVSTAVLTDPLDTTRARAAQKQWPIGQFGGPRYNPFNNWWHKRRSDKAAVSLENKVRLSRDPGAPYRTRHDP